LERDEIRRNFAATKDKNNKNNNSINNLNLRKETNYGKDSSINEN
jgi:hypothetical protein